MSSVPSCGATSRICVGPRPPYLEEAFRRFAAEFDESRALSLDAIPSAMQAAFACRREHSGVAEAEIAERDASSAEIQQILSKLTAFR